MTLTVDKNVVDGVSMTRTSNGDVYTQVVRVEGLEGPYHSRLRLAMDRAGYHTLSKAKHPTIKGLVATQVQARMLSFDIAEVTATFEPPTPETMATDDRLVEVGTVLVQKTTNTDADGAVITVDYTNSAGTKTTQVGTITKLAAQTTARATWTVNEGPLEDSKKFAGKVNSNKFLGGEPNTWLCTKYLGRSNDGGRTYHLEVECQYDEETWDATVVYVDTDTGEPPNDISDTNGMTTVAVYKAVTFPFG